MSRRPALVTQADLRRAIAAATQAGAGSVEVRPDGTIKILIDPQESLAQPVEPRREIVL